MASPRTAQTAQPTIPYLRMASEMALSIALLEVERDSETGISLSLHLNESRTPVGGCCSSACTKTEDEQAPMRLLMMKSRRVSLMLLSCWSMAKAMMTGTCLHINCGSHKALLSFLIKTDRFRDVPG